MTISRRLSHALYYARLAKQSFTHESRNCGNYVPPQRPNVVANELILDEIGVSVVKA